jgi:hypothetical protein
MIPVFIATRGPGLPGGRANRNIGGYALRIILISSLLALLGAVFLIAWIKPARSRRIPSEFMEAVALEPIVAGTLARIGSSARFEMSTSQGTTQWWRRRYEERSFLVTTTLTGPQVTPFLTAVRDSLEQRLLGVGATRRGLQSIGWPDSGSVAELRGPALVSMPYATRRRVGWVSLQATHAGDGALTLGVFIHEGPKPTD